MTRTLRALSALLAYPDGALKAGVGEIAAALRDEGLLAPARIAELGRLLDEIAATELLDLEERHVLLFDRTRTLSLDLLEHVHGESRDRGAAMVDLLETYRAAGFEPRGSVLPDHLPLLLEFLSLRPLAEAREMLADAARVIAGLALRLERRGAPHAAVMRALLDIADLPAGARPDAVAEAGEAGDAEGAEDPGDLAALDAAWEEAAVTFGPDPKAGCPAGRAMLARMALPVAGG